MKVMLLSFQELIIEFVAAYDQMKDAKKNVAKDQDDYREIYEETDKYVELVYTRIQYIRKDLTDDDKLLQKSIRQSNPSIVYPILKKYLREKYLPMKSQSNAWASKTTEKSIKKSTEKSTKIKKKVSWAK